MASAANWSAGRSAMDARLAPLSPTSRLVHSATAMRSKTQRARVREGAPRAPRVAMVDRGVHNPGLAFALVSVPALQLHAWVAEDETLYETVQDALQANARAPC